MSNIKDNLMTKDNLTYGQCYQRLMDIATDADDDMAYSLVTNKGKYQRIGMRQEPPQSQQQVAFVE